MWVQVPPFPPYSDLSPSLWAFFIFCYSSFTQTPIFAKFCIFGSCKKNHKFLKKADVDNLNFRLPYACFLAIFSISFFEILQILYSFFTFQITNIDKLSVNSFNHIRTLMTQKQSHILYFHPLLQKIDGC